MKANAKTGSRRGRKPGPPKPRIPHMLVTAVPVELRRGFKQACVKNDVTMCTVLRNMMEEYAVKHGTLVAM